MGGRPDARRLPRAPADLGAVALRGAVPQVRWREGGGGGSFRPGTLSDGLLPPSTDGAGAEASGCLPRPASSQAGGGSAPHGPIRAAEPVRLRGPPSERPGRPAEVRERGRTVTLSVVADRWLGRTPAVWVARAGPGVTARGRDVACGRAQGAAWASWADGAGARGLGGWTRVSPEAGRPPPGRPGLRGPASPPAPLWVPGSAGGIPLGRGLPRRGGRGAEARAARVLAGRSRAPRVP